MILLKGPALLWHQKMGLISWVKLPQYLPMERALRHMLNQRCTGQIRASQPGIAW